MIQIIDNQLQIPTEERVIGVQGDNLAHKRIFVIDKMVNGLDLSTFTPLIQLQAIYPSHPPYFDILHMEVEEEKIKLTWNIAEHDTSTKGNLYFQIRFSKYAGDKTAIYQTQKDVFIVCPTIEARAEYENMTPDVFEQYIADAKAEADRAKNIADGLVGRVDVAIENADEKATYAQNVGDNLLQKLADGEFKGDKGDGLNLAGHFDNLEALNTAFPNGDGQNTYLIDTNVFIWNGSIWKDGGRFQGKSAYEQAIIGGYTGTEQQFISELNDIKPHLSNHTSHVQTLTHSKSGTVHNLTGTLPSTGLVTANFIATAGCNKGDTITVNGVNYAIQDVLGKPISGFVVGAGVTATINIDTKIITVGGGGSGMSKSVWEYTLPISNEYEDAVPEPNWNVVDVTGQPSMTNSVVEGDFIYSVQYEVVNEEPKVVFYKQNAISKAYTSTFFANYGASSSATYFSIIYNDEIYAVQFDANFNGCDLSKLNIDTKTRTRITNLKTTGKAGYTGYVYHVTDDMLLIMRFVSRSIYYSTYSFATNIETDLKLVDFNSFGDTYARCSGIQYNSVRNKIRGTFGFYNTSLYKNCLWEFDITTRALKIKNANWLPTFNYNAATHVQLLQIGDKCMYTMNSIQLGGKHTGEVDLWGDTFNSTKYPELPTIYSYNVYHNIHLIGDMVITQDKGRFNFLRLIPRLPKDMPPIMYLLKGDIYNCPYITENIRVRGIDSTGQKAFAFSNMPQIALEDATIHDRMYTLNGAPTKLLVKRGG